MARSARRATSRSGSARLGILGRWRAAGGGGSLGARWWRVRRCSPAATTVFLRVDRLITYESVRAAGAPDASLDELQADGRTIVGYFSAGSYEEWQPDADTFSDEDLGAPFAGWERPHS